jgi:hypothetical protein
MLTRARGTSVFIAAAVASALGLVSGCSSSGGDSAAPATPSPTATHKAVGVHVANPRPADAMCGWLAKPPQRYQHVMWIWFENHSYNKIVGSSDAPYLNDTVATKCAVATNYHNASHPSLPNYLAATSGLTNGVSSDCSPSSCSSTSPSIFKQLEDAGLSWKGYAESMPRNCAIFDKQPYAARHNPPVYYNDIKQTCGANDVPLGEPSGGTFDNDLTNDALPSFAFITPNLCSDMHSCPVHNGDDWLKTWLPKIVASPAYSAGNTAVFVTFDEGGGGSHGEDCASTSNTDESCHIATFVLGPAVPPGAQVGTWFSHYSLLRATEAMLGLKTYLGNAATAPGMRADFHL